MKVGIQPDVKHRPREAFEFAERNRFNHVEILMDHPYYVGNEIFEMKDCYDLEILLHASTAINLLSISKNIRKASYKELFESYIFAEKLEAEVLTFHIGFNPAFVKNGEFYFMVDFYDEHNEKVIVQEMLPFLKKSSFENVFLALENTVLIDGKIRFALERVLEETDLKLTLDVGHYNIQENPLFLEKFERVVNVHVHDNNGKFDEHLALGRGTVDMSKFPLKGYSGFLTIETRDEKAIIETLEYLKKVIA